MSGQAAVDPQHLLLIVVGAHLEAELADRPLGYRVQDDVVRWQRKTPEAVPLAPMVCTDLWYLNASELMLVWYFLGRSWLRPRS